MLRKIFRWFFILMVTLIIGIGASLFLFKDQIIQQVIAELNRHLAVPIEVSKVDIDLFHGLPDIAIAFHDVVIAPEGETLLEAEKLYAIINPIQLIRGDLDISRLEVSKGELVFIVFKDKSNNLSTIFKQEDSSGVDSTALTLSSVRLHDMALVYRDEFSGLRQELEVAKLSGRFSLNLGIYDIAVNGSVIVNKVETRSWTSERPRQVDLDLALRYESKQQTLQITRSQLQYAGAMLAIEGSAHLNNKPVIDINITGNALSFDLLTGLLPDDYSQYLRKYHSSGDLSVSASLKGPVSATAMPSMAATVNLHNVNLTDKEYNANIDALSCSAKLNMNDLSRLSTGSITIKDATGQLEGKPFSASIAIQRFDTPKINAHINGAIGASWLMAALQMPNAGQAKGEVTFALDMAGPLKGKLKESLKVAGQLDLDNLEIPWSKTISIRKITGQVRFRDDAISLVNVYLNWLESDLLVNGTVDDFWTSLQEDSGHLLLSSNVRADYLRVEDIVKLIEVAPVISTGGEGTNDLNLSFDLSGSFDHLSFDRFRGKKIAGEFLYEDGILEVLDLNGKGMGGGMKVNGKLEVKENKDFYVEAKAQTKDVHIDSLFYVFYNFSQDFIMDKHLKGKLYADINTSMYFDSTWRFRRQLLKANARLGIVAGELNDFQPIMELSRYLNDKEDNLAQLRFSDLVNHIDIRQDTVFIPEMSIQTNVRNIALGGYHTLDQHINYQVAVPVINERVDKDEAFGAVQKSSEGSPNLLFRIKGTAFDYKVSYDLHWATENVLKLLNITKIFKKKEEIPFDSSFLDDDEFDWKN